MVYMINGIMMLLSFFLCRVMLFPVLYWWYSNVLGISLISTIISIPCWCHIATLGLWLPQLFWFNKMLKGSLKVIRGRKKREDYLVAATDHINAGDREMNNGVAIGEKDSSQDNFIGNDVEESKDKFE